MDQVHKNSVEAVSSVSPPIKTTDALISTSDDIVLSAVSADCLPITIAKQDGSAFAIIHAGWKGLIAGVIQSCISSFIKDEVDLSAWIGPSISSKHYEVDKAFYDAFLSSDEASLSNFNKIRSDKWLFSLQGEAHRILKKYDVEPIAMFQEFYQECKSSFIFHNLSQTSIIHKSIKKTRQNLLKIDFKGLPHSISKSPHFIDFFHGILFSIKGTFFSNKSIVLVIFSNLLKK